MDNSQKSHFVCQSHRLRMGTILWIMEWPQWGRPWQIDSWQNRPSSWKGPGTATTCTDTHLSSESHYSSKYHTSYWWMDWLMPYVESSHTPLLDVELEWLITEPNCQEPGYPSRPNHPLLFPNLNLLYLLMPSALVWIYRLPHLVVGRSNYLKSETSSSIRRAPYSASIRTTPFGILK